MPFGEHSSWDYYPRHLYQREIMDPYVAMDHFFQCMNLVDFRKSIDDFFHSACAGTCTLKQAPVDALFLYELIEKMMELAHILFRKEDEDGFAEPSEEVPVTEADVVRRLGLLKFHYEKRYRHIRTWDYFPRQLTSSELLNPQLVFRQLFELYSLPAWRDELKMCMEAAISRQSVYESMGDQSNVYMISTLIKKLVEAFFVLHTVKPEKIVEYEQHQLQDGQQTGIPSGEYIDVEEETDSVAQ